MFQDLFFVLAPFSSVGFSFSALEYSYFSLCQLFHTCTLVLKLSRVGLFLNTEDFIGLTWDWSSWLWITHFDRQVTKLNWYFRKLEWREDLNIFEYLQYHCILILKWSDRGDMDSFSHVECLWANIFTLFTHPLKPRVISSLSSTWKTTWHLQIFEY